MQHAFRLSHVILQGTMPKVQMALQLYNILSESDTNLRQPIRLESQLLQDARMDSEVGKSMLQLLQVCQHFQFSCDRLFWKAC